MRIKTLEIVLMVANASTSLLTRVKSWNRQQIFKCMVYCWWRFVSNHTDTHSAGNIELETNGTERMRISGATGEVSIASSNVTHKCTLIM